MEQGLEALQSHPGAVQLGLVALALPDGLHQGELELARINGGQQLASAHHLSFLEQHRLHHPGHLRPHPDTGLRGDRTQRFENNRNIRPLCRGHADRGGRRAAPCA